jgi:hypothetical protein
MGQARRTTVQEGTTGDCWCGEEARHYPTGIRPPSPLTTNQPKFCRPTQQLTLSCASLVCWSAVELLAVDNPDVSSDSGQKDMPAPVPIGVSYGGAIGSQDDFAY